MRSAFFLIRILGRETNVVPAKLVNNETTEFASASVAFQMSSIAARHSKQLEALNPARESTLNVRIRFGRQRKRRPDAMKPSERPLVLDAEPHEVESILAELDDLIAGAEASIERQCKHVQAVVSDIDASMKAIAQLDAMASALLKLKTHRARIVRGTDVRLGC
jgi:hypothetical protein